MSSKGARVFVLDDEPSVRKSLARLLTAAGYRVEVFASAREFLDRGREDEVACLLLDLRMPEVSGLELQEALAATDRPLSIVFLTGHGDIPTSVRAMRAGAVDFLSKPVHEKDLLEAIERSLERSEQGAGEQAAAREAKRRLAELTPREHEVLLHVLAGEMNKQIASALGVTVKTVKVHRGRVMHKMRVQSVADLVRLCQVAGIRTG